MVDIHTHIIYGVDDGAQTLDEALWLIDIAAHNGTSTLVCTPHSNMTGRFENYETEKENPIPLLFLQLQQEVKKHAIPIQLVRGMEIFGNRHVASHIKTRDLISLHHSGYYLVEFPFSATPDTMWDILSQVFAAGGVPVIAHPERYDAIQDMPGIAYEFRKEGALIQVNKGSLLGQFGREVEKTAWALFDHMLITCIASDAHSPDYRSTNLGEINALLRKEFSSDTADILLHENPLRMISGKKVLPQKIFPFERLF